MSMVTPVLNKIYVLKCDGCCNHISNTLIQNGKGEKTRTKGSCALPVPGAGVCTGSSQHELSQMPKRGGKKPRQPTQQKTPRRTQTEEASFRSSELQPPVYAAHAGSCHPFPTTLPGLRGESGSAPGATPGVPGGTGGNQGYREGPELLPAWRGVQQRRCGLGAGAGPAAATHGDASASLGGRGPGSNPRPPPPRPDVAGAARARSAPAAPAGTAPAPAAPPQHSQPVRARADGPRILRPHSRTFLRIFLPILPPRPSGYWGLPAVPSPLQMLGQEEGWSCLG